ncbi:MAG: ribokinase [Chlorobi bacterium]|nr:ribokinase [Chlorobiota bacterium]
MVAKKILVVGSSNVDFVVKTKKLPSSGETFMGESFSFIDGGKGANQAVAAKRLGGEVYFMGKIGEDGFGRSVLNTLQREQINIEMVIVDKTKLTGIAVVTVNDRGENTIVVVPGANETLSVKDFKDKITNIKDFDVIMLQLEIPLETVEYIVDVAFHNNIMVILNPAPAKELSDKFIKKLSIITPNELEAEILTGVNIDSESSAYEAAKILKSKGVDSVIITMGAKGAYLLSDEFIGWIGTSYVNVVDTTAAGDTFNGALAVALSENKSLRKAVEFACKAASYSVTKMGAQSSIPYLADIS